jgi:hypothetical protein
MFNKNLPCLYLAQQQYGYHERAIQDDDRQVSSLWQQTNMDGQTMHGNMENWSQLEANDTDTGVGWRPIMVITMQLASK